MIDQESEGLPPVTRFRLLIEYDGRPFCGWQRQKNAPSVQEALEAAVFKFCGEQREVVAAGRTDTGVHASGMVAHVDIAKQVDARVVRNAVNAHVQPHPIAVVAAKEAPDDFHARFSATERQYIYTIVNRPAPLTYDRGLAWHVPYALDVARMNDAASVLVGHHDFTSFRSVHCQSRSPVKTLDELRVESIGDRLLVHVRARSFLHNQVRIMTGGLVRVGRGKWTRDDLQAALDARDRRAGPMTAPPDGLSLTGVGYPEK